MTPDDHSCPDCGCKCSCGATLLDDIHVSPHPVFKHLDEAGRRLHIRNHNNRCVHKCPPGYGENWVSDLTRPRERGSIFNE